MTEPVKEQTIKVDTGKKGNQPYADEQFWRWLDMIRPWLKLGNSIYYACSKAGIDSHYDVILNRYKAGGIFARKIDALRAGPGELVNETLVALVEKISDRVKTNGMVTREEFDVLKLMAEKHRTSQPFFTDRHENAEVDPSKVGKILDVLEEQTDYGELGSKAKKQMVENDPSLQDKGQERGDSDVQPQPNATASHGGSGGASVQPNS